MAPLADCRSAGWSSQSLGAPPGCVLRDRDLDVSQVELRRSDSQRFVPPRALRLVREWAALHADELADNWERAQALEPLVPIEPLA